MWGMPEPSSTKLSVAERILRLQDEWDEIAADPDQVEVSEAQRSELDRRRSAHAASPDDVVAWEDVKRGLRTRH